MFPGAALPMYSSGPEITTQRPQGACTRALRHLVPPGKAHSSTELSLAVSENPSADDVTVRRQHVLQFLLVVALREVGNVQIGGILFLLLW